jgi:hypothetical protein
VTATAFLGSEIGSESTTVKTDPSADKYLLPDSGSELHNIENDCGINDMSFVIIGYLLY